MSILEELQKRGLKYQSTSNVEAILDGPITVYAGFDPTADSLHVGNLVPLLTLRRFKEAGHKTIALVGGATALIGDPSGKSAERTLQDPAEVNHRSSKIWSQISKIVGPDVIVNNIGWTENLNTIEFLRDIGKHFSINQMLSQDSVKQRLGNGLSFTEFSYMLLQANDFLVLSRSFGCNLQIGGSDQWGNIVAGTHLVRAKDQKTVHGITLPLMTTSSGQKLGKTAGGSIWLDPAKTTPFVFYQYWINLDSFDAERLARMLLDNPSFALDALTPGNETLYSESHIQKSLAYSLTEMIHGTEIATRCAHMSRCLFGTSSFKSLESSDFESLALTIPTLRTSDLLTLDKSLVATGLSSSRGEAIRHISSGGVYITDARCVDPKRQLSKEDCLLGKYLVLRRGKKNHALVILET